MKLILETRGDPSVGIQSQVVIINWSALHYYCKEDYELVMQDLCDFWGDLLDDRITIRAERPSNPPNW